MPSTAGFVPRCRGLCFFFFFFFFFFFYFYAARRGKGSVRCPPPSRTRSIGRSTGKSRTPLSPDHLQDLPGFTRCVYRRDHAVITPERVNTLGDLIVFFCRVNTLGAYLITPAMGAHFSMYLAKMQASSHSALPPQDVERFLFVVEGAAILSNLSGSHSIPVDSYAYLPANSDHILKSEEAATLVVFERRYVSMENHIPEQIIGSTDKQPLLDTPG